MQRLFCPHCGRQINATDLRSGQTVDCPYCNKSFINTPKESPQFVTARPTSTKSVETIVGIPKGAFLIAVAIVFVGVMGAIVYYQSTRFEIVNQENVAYRIDRHTGKVAIINKFGKLTEVKEAKEEVRAPERNLTQSERSEVTGRGSLTSYGTFSGDMYNGNTDVVVTGFTVEIQYKNSLDENDVVSRRYRCTTTVSPLKSSSFSCSVVAFDKEYEFKGWYISDVKGRDVKND